VKPAAFRSRLFRNTSTSGSAIPWICLAVRSVRTQPTFSLRVERTLQRAGAIHGSHRGRRLIRDAGSREWKVGPREVPLRNALNEVLRTEYVKDCEKGLARWNKALADEESISVCTFRTFVFIVTSVNSPVIILIWKVR